MGVTDDSIAGISGLNTLAGKAGGNSLGRRLTRMSEGAVNLFSAWKPPMQNNFNTASGAASGGLAGTLGQAVDQWAGCVVSLFEWNSPEAAM